MGFRVAEVCDPPRQYLAHTGNPRYITQRFGDYKPNRECWQGHEICYALHTRLSIADYTLEATHTATGTDERPIDKLVVAAKREIVTRYVEAVLGHKAQHHLRLVISHEIQLHQRLRAFRSPHTFDVATRGVEPEWEFGDLLCDKITTLGSEHPQRDICLSVYHIFRDV